MSRPIPATNETHGPFRKVERVVTRQTEWPPRSGVLHEMLYELLECGHDGRMVGLVTRWAYGRATLARRVATRRRCGPCGTAAQQAAAEAKAKIAFRQAEQLEKWRRTPEGKAVNDEAVARRRSFVVLPGQTKGSM